MPRKKKEEEAPKNKGGRPTKKKLLYDGLNIDKDLMQQMNTSVKKSEVKKEMIAKYGVSGIVKNDIPEELRDIKVINEIEELLQDIKRYRSPDVYSFIPLEVSERLKKYNEHIKYIKKDGKEEDATSGGRKEYVAILKNASTYCIRCGGYNRLEKFFDSFGKTKTGKVHICKNCIGEMCQEFFNEYKDLRYVLLLMCQYTNTIYQQDVVNRAIKNFELKNEEITMLYNYYRVELMNFININTGKMTKGYTFEYSNFEGNIYKFVDIPEGIPTVYFGEQNKETVEVTKKRNGMYAKKWGSGFTVEEYQSMEQLFNEYSEFKSTKNVAQKNALIEYCRLKVKLDNSIGKSDINEISKLQTMVDKAADNAQIKLNQLSADDFGEGVDSWTSLVSLVEEYNSVIPIMPKIKKMPYDDIDFIIWEVVNYCRRLQELPEVPYEDIWNFVDEKFIEEMKRRGYTKTQIEKERNSRNAIYKDLPDSYIEPLWLNPDVLVDDGEDDIDEE